MTLDTDALLKFAKEIAMRAGEMLKEARTHHGFSTEFKADHELVTTTDLAIDTFLCDAIRNTYPEHQILSEESSPNLSLTEAPVWVIDPIDGTVNYAHGHRHVAISIGLFVSGKRFMGVVNAPFLDELYWAIKGKGAFLNGVQLAVSDDVALRNALVATGFPYQKDQLDPLIERVSRVLHHCQDIRRNGSAALDLCWLAAGRFQTYYESVKPWDMAAGALIASEAGAQIGHFAECQPVWPDEINGDALLVCVPSLYDSMLKLLTLNH